MLGKAIATVAMYAVVVFTIGVVPLEDTTMIGIIFFMLSFLGLAMIWG